MSRIAAVSCGWLPPFSVAWLCVVLGGCAQGFEGPQSFGYEAPGSGSQDNGSIPGTGAGAGSGGTTAMGGSTGGTAGGMSAGAGAYSGDPCDRGEVEVCTCASGTMGSRSCAFDADSPTEGSFGECARCAPGGGGSGGTSGSSGAGGSSGSGSSGSGSSGSGGSGSSGSGSSGSGGTGSAGSGSTTPPPSGGSKPAWCVFVPIPIPGC